MLLLRLAGQSTGPGLPADRHEIRRREGTFPYLAGRVSLSSRSIETGRGCELMTLLNGVAGWRGHGYGSRSPHLSALELPRCTAGAALANSDAWADDSSTTEQRGEPRAFAAFRQLQRCTPMSSTLAALHRTERTILLPRRPMRLYQLAAATSSNTLSARHVSHSQGQAHNQWTRTRAD